MVGGELVGPGGSESNERSQGNLRPWPKGVSGNPGGRPTALRELAQSIRARTPELIARLFEIALKGKAGNPTTVRAAEILLERGYGKAPVVLEDADGKQVRVGIIVLPAERSDE